MKILKNEKESPPSYIDTQDVTSSHYLPPYGLKISRYIQENQTKQNILVKQSNNTTYTDSYDFLTGLPNQQLIKKLLEKAISLVKKNDELLAILYLNIRDFKQVNIIYGHALGNQVLIIIAKRLRKLARNGRLLSRIGGDEFLMSLIIKNEELPLIDELKVVISKAVNKPISIEGFIINIEIDIEAVAYPIHGDKIDVLIDVANKKRYKTKQKHN